MEYAGEKLFPWNGAPNRMFVTSSTESTDVMKDENQLLHLTDSYFSRNVEDATRLGILRYCSRTSEEKRLTIIKVFSVEVSDLLTGTVTDDDTIGHAASILFSLANDMGFGVFVIDECRNAILKFYADTSSYFLDHSRIIKSDTLRLFVQSLLAYVKHSLNTATESTALIGRNIFRRVRLLMSLDIPTNIMFDCGVIVAMIDFSKGNPSSSLWLLKNSEKTQSLNFIALFYGVLLATPSRRLSKIIVEIENSSKFDFAVSLQSILDSYEGHKSDLRYLLAGLSFFQAFTRKVSQTNLALSLQFYEHFVTFLWHHCDHFVSAVRSLSQQCLKNTLSMMDEKVVGEIWNLVIKNSSVSEKFCSFIRHNSAIMSVDDQLLVYCGRLITSQIRLIDDAVLLAQGSEAYVTLLRSAYRGEFDRWFDQWIKPVSEMSDAQLDGFREHVMVAVITLSHRSLEALIPLVSDDQLNLILEYVLLIKDLKVRSQRLKIIDPRILKAVVSSNPLAVLTCIVEKSDLEECANLLRSSIDAVFSCTDEHQRRTFVQKFKKIVADDDLICWTQQRCFSNLFAGASFDRRHSALLLLETFPHPLRNCSRDHLSVIFACLADSYPENQRLAVKLLASVVDDQCKDQQLRLMYEFFFGALFEANVSEHDTCAYVGQLLCCLSTRGYDILFEYGRIFGLMEEDFTQLNECDDSYLVHTKILLLIVKNRLKKFELEPLYGLLRVIRHLLECTPIKHNWQQLVSETVEICIECNLQVVFIVKQSAPEGFLPESELVELDDTDESYLYASSQKALLRGWRTVKETSLLLTHLLTIESLDQNLMHDVGNHLKTLLFEVKHKGAIEVVYLAASAFCRICVRSKNKCLSSEPKQWLHEISELIINPDDSRVCRWRRSAGIPFIVQAVLGANVAQSDTLCDEFVNELLKIYADEAAKSESKIHAANTLRVLFKNRNFARVVENHAALTIKLAVNGVASARWDIRNTSWLLLGSVMARLFGVNMRGPDAVTFFRKYPSLLDFFLARLRGYECSQLKNQSSVLAVLLIFATFQSLDRYERDEGSADGSLKLKSFLPAVFECAASSVWKIRVTAARAILALLTRDLYVPFVSSLCFLAKQRRLDENSLHGIFLQLESVFGCTWVASPAEKDHLQRVLVDFTKDTNSILEDGKRSVVVKRQLLTLRMLTLRTLAEWKLNDDDGASRLAADTSNWPPVVSPDAHCYIDDVTYVCSAILYRISCWLLTSRNDDQQLKELVDYCMLQHPATAMAVLETFLRPTSSCAVETNDAVFRVLRDQFASLNACDRNCVVQRIKRWPSLCPLLNQVVHDSTLRDASRVCRILRILSCLADGSEFFEPLATETVEYLCQHVGHDEEASMAVVEYVSQAFKAQAMYSLRDRDRILRSICDISSAHVVSHFHRGRIALYDVFLTQTHDILLVLDAWTQRLEFATHEESGSLNVLVDTFHHDSLKTYEPVVCAVALLGWTLGDIGFIWRRIESQGASFAFDEHWPQRFENYVLLSRACSSSLRQLVRSHADVRRTPLDPRLRRWLCDRCALPAQNADRLLDVVSLLGEPYARLGSSSSDRCFDAVACLRRDAVFERFAAEKIGLAISAFEDALVGECGDVTRRTGLV